MWQTGTIVITIARPEPLAHPTAQAIWKILSSRDIEDASLDNLLPMLRALQILNIEATSRS